MYLAQAEPGFLHQLLAHRPPVVAAGVAEQTLVQVLEPVAVAAVGVAETMDQTESTILAVVAVAGGFHHQGSLAATAAPA